MAKQLDRIRHFTRSLNLVRQQLGWQKLREITKAEGLAPVVIDPEDDGDHRILVLAPHPDDEAFGCGGALINHHQHGDSIQVIYLCSGGGGKPGATNDSSLVTQRHNEALSGLKLIDARGEFWNQLDGALRTNPELVSRVADVLESLKPDRIYTPWLADNHPDHMATTELLFKALEVCRTKAEVWQYEVWSPLIPNRFLPIGPLLSQKERLVDCHESQLGTRLYKEGVLGLNAYRGMQVGLSEPAEAYFALPAEQCLELLS